MDFWTPIWTGTISGVASGSVLALFFWVRRQRQECRERRDQIKHIAKVIEYWRKEILSVEESLALALLPASERGPHAIKRLRALE